MDSLKYEDTAGTPKQCGVVVTVRASGSGLRCVVNFPFFRGLRQVTQLRLVVLSALSGRSSLRGRIESGYKTFVVGRSNLYCCHCGFI